MKKITIVLFLIMFLLVACGTNGNNTEENNQNQETIAEVNNNLGGNEISEVEVPIVETSTEAATLEIENNIIPTTCTAVSYEKSELSVEGDWISGAIEDYAVTLIDYSDFQ